jgi:hypothetical protein
MLCHNIITTYSSYKNYISLHQETGLDILLMFQFLFLLFGTFLNVKSFLLANLTVIGSLRIGLLELFALAQLIVFNGECEQEHSKKHHGNFERSKPLSSLFW